MTLAITNMLLPERHINYRHNIDWNSSAQWQLHLSKLPCPLANLLRYSMLSTLTALSFNKRFLARCLYERYPGQQLRILLNCKQTPATSIHKVPMLMRQLMGLSCSSIGLGVLEAFHSQSELSLLHVTILLHRGQYRPVDRSQVLSRCRSRSKSP